MRNMKKWQRTAALALALLFPLCAVSGRAAETAESPTAVETASAEPERAQTTAPEASAPSETTAEATAPATETAAPEATDTAAPAQTDTPAPAETDAPAPVETDIPAATDTAAPSDMPAPSETTQAPSVSPSASPEASAEPSSTPDVGEKKIVESFALPENPEAKVQEKPTLEEVLAKLPSTIGVHLSDGTEAEAAISWSCADYSEDKAEYQFVAALTDPAFAVAEGVALPTFRLIVEGEQRWTSGAFVFKRWNEQGLMLIAYGGESAEVEIPDSVEGLPEPGYHISLSEDAIEWLAEQVGSIEPQDLSEYLAFTYDDGDVTRRWELEYMGIYESDAETGDPLRYVYSLNSTGDAPAVRLQYWDGSSYVFDDDIDMSETAVNASYTMSLYPGSLDQGLVKAVLTVSGESIEAKALSGTGTLTVLSTVNKDGNTTEIGGDAGAVNGGSVTAVGDAEYYVNDTEVPITDPDRVKLLVDEVSNSGEYVEAMAGDAMDTVMSEYGLDGAGCETFYLDLVDTDNGNAKVTMGAGDSLKIYWPIPEQAGSSSRLYVVHYYGLDRTETDAGAELSAEPRHVQQADIEQVGGVRYAVFEVSSFSPFALVWEESVDSPLPIIPPVTPSEPDYTPNWLNTTDHVSYIIGYSDGTVKPNAGITRAEVATIFFRLLTDGARERFWSETSAYSDVAAGSWYNIAVSTLSNMGILGGYEDGTFHPNASITRAEFAKIAVSFFDWADVYAVNSFVDVRDSAWYANYVAVAAELGLIEGYGGNVFRPEATITRAEACTIINRTLGRAPDTDHLLPVAQMNTWPDNSDTGVWYYAQIQEATNSHDYRWLGDIEQWTAKLTDPDWDKLQY